jgi:hypothetical protein
LISGERFIQNGGGCSIRVPALGGRIILWN